MTTAEILAACDTRLTQLRPAIEAQMTNYLRDHGSYWQGLRSHTVTPAEGVSVAPDVGTKHPTDQPAPWPPVLANAPMPMALTPDVYDGPSGLGYTLRLEVLAGGVLYRRVDATGPEAWRAQPWAPAPSVGVP